MYWNLHFKNNKRLDLCSFITTNHKWKLFGTKSDKQDKTEAQTQDKKRYRLQAYLQFL